MKQLKSTNNIETKCPACEQFVVFDYVGEQHWPEKVAEKRGVNSVSLWTCRNCGSTIDGSHLSNGD